MRTTLSIILLFNFQIIFCQKIIEIWPNKIPNSIESKEKELIVFKDDSTMYSYSKAHTPTLEIFLPPKNLVAALTPKDADTITPKVY